MSNICHIIYIKFNYNDIDKLRTRIELFEKYCLPSLLNQTNKNFKVYMNINTKEPYYSLLKKYKDYNNIYLTNLSLDKIIKKERGNQLLITTRLDTDDSINIMFVDGIQKFIQKHNRLLKIYDTILIDFQYGIRLLDSDYSIKNKYYHGPVSSPFLTIITKKLSNIVHCRTDYHSLIHTLKTINQTFHINNKIPMWIQVIHDNNINPLNIRIALYLLLYD